MSLATPKKQRLDELLVARGLAESRAQAKALIMTGRVRRGTERLDKPGKEFASDTELTVEQPPRFVSRGGEKLAAAIAHFGIDLRGAHLLDVGASTGGFTDCALQAGAASAVCLDVGRAQLHAKLRNDPRVTNLEKVNARHLTPSDLPRDTFDAVVMDLSFISLCSVLPAVWSFVQEGTGVLVALVKPQFEAGKAEVDKGRGVIRDAAVQEAALAKVRDFALAELPAAELVGHIDSPIKGADGNREFLLALRKRLASDIHSDEEPDTARREATVNTKEQGMPAAGISGILSELPAQYVGAGRGTVVITPDATQRQDALATQKPTVIESSLPASMTGKEIRAKAKELYPSGQKFTNAATGRIIEMVSRARGELAYHGANLRTLKIMPHLKELVENAIPLFENTGDSKHWLHYGAATVIDGEAFFVRLVVFESNQRKFQLDIFHDAQITPREEFEGAPSPGRSLITNEDAGGRGPSRDIAVKWWQLVKERESLEAKGSSLQGLPDKTNRVAKQTSNKQPCASHRLAKMKPSAAETE